MAKDLKEFLTRIKEDPAFANEVREKGKSIMEAEKISGEDELAIKVGKELGYEFTMSDIDRNIAEDQEIDDKELAKAAGGAEPTDEWCWGESYGCHYFNDAPLQEYCTDSPWC